MRLAPLVALVPLVCAACRIDRADAGRPPGTPSVVDSLTRVEQDSATADAVRLVLLSFYRRLADRDTAALAALFWPGAVVTGVAAAAPGTMLATDVVRGLRAGSGPPITEAAVVESEIQTYGNIAQAWVVQRTRERPATSRYAVAAIHLMRHGRTWRIISVAVTDEDPARPLAPGRP